MSSKVRFWISFILILFFSATISQILLESKAYLNVTKVKRNYIELAAVIATGLIGMIYFAKPKEKVLKFLWSSIYLCSIVFLAAISIVDNYIISITRNDGQYRFTTLKEFLISPLLFIIFCVFEIVLKKRNAVILNSK